MNDHQQREDRRRAYAAAYDTAFAKGYNPNQPRLPAGNGSPAHGGSSGEWASSDGGAGGHPLHQGGNAHAPKIPEEPSEPDPRVAERQREIARQRQRAKEFITKWWGVATTGGPEELMTRLKAVVDGKKERVAALADYAAGMARYVNNVEKFHADHPQANPDDQPAGVVDKYGLDRPGTPKFALGIIGPGDTGEAKKDWDGNIKRVAQAWKDNPDIGQSDVTDIVQDLLHDRLGVSKDKSLWLAREESLRARRAAYNAAFGARPPF